MNSDCPINQQDRLVLDPRDSNGGVVTLDTGALTITKTNQGTGTFEYNAETNGCVFRPPEDATGSPITTWHIEVDGQPGPGQSFLPVDVEQTAVAVGAVTAGASLSRESKGTPA